MVGRIPHLLLQNFQIAVLKEKMRNLELILTNPENENIPVQKESAEDDLPSLEARSDRDSLPPEPPSGY